MNGSLTIGPAFLCFIAGASCWLGWQPLRQNYRILLRLDELEQRLDELEFGELSSSRREEAQTGKSEIQNPKSEIDQSLVTSAPTSGADNHRASRFSNHSLARSRIKRNGLKAGTVTPGFQLPRLDGSEVALEELRGKRVLLVFSDPHCGPCNALAPELEKFHRVNRLRKRTTGSDVAQASFPSSESPVLPNPRGKGITVVMISRGEPKENRAKVKEHGLTFPVVLQQRWEISRSYAMFATPVAYLIDEAGIIAHDVAVGVEPILQLLAVLSDRSRSAEPVAGNST